jgi:hypothetical protein
MVVRYRKNRRGKKNCKESSSSGDGRQRYHPELGDESFKSNRFKRFGQAVSCLIRCRNVRELYIALGDLLAQEIILNINILGAGVELRVPGESYRALVVSQDRGRLRKGDSCGMTTLKVHLGKKKL